MMGAEGVDQQKAHAQGAEALFEGDSELPGTPPTQEEKTIALIAHIGGIFTWWLIPLVLYLLKRNDSRFINDQAKEALNFNITMTIATIIAGMSVLILVGVVAVPLVLIYHLVGCILAAVSVNQGKMFRYRYCVRLIK
jgi:uncharacterized Tic20 family protein